jgi:hypothetical protein
MSAESLAVTSRAPGVEYFPSALDPQIELFRCPSYRICLTAAACSYPVAAVYQPVAPIYAPAQVYVAPAPTGAAANAPYRYGLTDFGPKSSEA